MMSNQKGVYGVKLTVISIVTFIGVIFCINLCTTNIERSESNFLIIKEKKIIEQNKNETIYDNKYEVQSASGIKKSRKKRYVAFPEGSSFSMAFCLTVGLIGNPQYTYLSWSINWGVAYDLPNETWILNQKNYKKPMPKQIVQRRNRREVFNQLETAMDNMGYNGRQCIMRALCESKQYFYKPKTNLAESLIKSIFSLPTMNVLPFEHKDLYEYDKAHRAGKNQIYCPGEYPECTFSLIELALGQYSSIGQKIL